MKAQTYENKMSPIRRATKLIDEHACDPESARQRDDGTQDEIVRVIGVGETHATAALVRLPRLHVSIPLTLADGISLHDGMRVLLACRKPERFGFHGSRDAWQCVAILAVETA